MRTLSLLAALDVQECNGHYTHFVVQRIEYLAKIKSCDVLELTLREVISCIEAASLDYNEIVPILFPGSKSRPEAEVRACLAERLQ